MKFGKPVAVLGPALLALGVLAPGSAGGVTITLAPAVQTVEVGDAPAVDVTFGDLGGEIVSAYDLDLTYDADLLAATDVLFTTSLGDALFFEVFEDFDLSTPGIVDLAQLSLLDDDALFGLQGGESVTVATIVFEAVAAGTSELAFVFDAVNDAKGRNGEVLPLVGAGAVIEIGRGTPPSNPIPEPSAALVFASGLLFVRAALSRTRA